ncbi:hypothetical protein A2U01_0094018, partial [Trifolium medium]|nr:hypothetical protein [Trifolium medium]
SVGGLEVEGLIQFYAGNSGLVFFSSPSEPATSPSEDSSYALLLHVVVVVPC